MAKYTNINGGSATIVDIDTNNTGQQYAGNISSISICNNSTNEAVVTLRLYAHDTSTTLDNVFMLRGVKVPFGVTLILDHDISFDVSKYHLVLENAGTAPSVTVIIK